ncbi:MAG: hypothetical protein ACKV2V_07345 [Blastocatellia bacterium]
MPPGARGTGHGTGNTSWGKGKMIPGDSRTAPGTGITERGKGKMIPGKPRTVPGRSKTGWGVGNTWQGMLALVCGSFARVCVAFALRAGRLAQWRLAPEYVEITRATMRDALVKAPDAVAQEVLPPFFVTLRVRGASWRRILADMSPRGPGRRRFLAIVTLIGAPVAGNGVDKRQKHTL